MHFVQKSHNRKVIKIYHEHLRLGEVYDYSGLFKIKFHLYATFGTISSLLIYVYRKGFGSTVVNLSDLKIYYPFLPKIHSPGKARLGSAHGYLLQSVAVVTSHHHTISPSFQAWIPSIFGNEWLQGP